MTFIFIEKITRNRYIFFKKFIHYSNLSEENFIIIKNEK